MDVKTFTVPEEAYLDANMPSVELVKDVETLLKLSDFISVHVPLLP